MPLKNRQRTSAHHRNVDRGKHDAETTWRAPRRKAGTAALGCDQTFRSLIAQASKLPRTQAERRGTANEVHVCTAAVLPGVENGLDKALGGAPLRVESGIDGGDAKLALCLGGSLSIRTCSWDGRHPPFSI